MNFCLNCSEKTNNPKFCSSSCSASYNNIAFPKKKPKDYPLARKLREQGCSYGYISKKLDIPYSSARNWVNDIVIDKKDVSRTLREGRKVSLGELKTKSIIRQRLIEIRGKQCEECGISEWNGEQITLEMHRKLGKDSGYNPDNIILLCPNCHSITPDYKNKHP